MEEELKIAKRALREIKKAEGAFSTDRLTHATNTIEHMQNLAKEALEKITSFSSIN